MTSIWRTALGDARLMKYVLLDVVLVLSVDLATFAFKRETLDLPASLLVMTILLAAEHHLELRSLEDRIAQLMGFGHSALDEPGLLALLARTAKALGVIHATRSASCIYWSLESLQRCVREVERLAAGEFSAGPEHAHSVLTRLLRSSQRCVFATSFTSDPGFWLSGVGKEYLAENAAAVKRGVKVTRVFVVEPSDLTIDVRRLITNHARGAMDTRVAYTDRLGDGGLYDMAIFDDEYVAYAEVVPGTKKMRRIVVYRGTEHLASARETLNRILSECCDWRRDVT